MAAQTLVTNLTLKSTSFEAGMKGAAWSAKAFGGNIQKLGGGLGQFTGLMGQTVPALGQFGGVISVGTQMFAQFATAAASAASATAMFNVAASVGAMAAIAVMSAAIGEVNKESERIEKNLAAMEERQKRMRAIGREAVGGAGLDKQGVELQQFLAELDRQAEELKKARKELTDEGFWGTGGGTKAEVQRNADELASVQQQQAMATMRLEEMQRDKALADADKKMWAAGDAKEKADEEYASWQRTLRAKLADEAEAARQKEEKAIWKQYEREDEIVAQHLELVLTLKKKAYDEAAEAQAEASQKEYDYYLKEATKLKDAELAPTKGGGAARMIDTSRISLEGLRMNTEPINEAKKSNALLQKIDAKLGVIANDKGFF